MPNELDNALISNPVEIKPATETAVPAGELELLGVPADEITVEEITPEIPPAVEAKPEPEPEVELKKKKTIYTPEELIASLEQDTDLDTERLSPEGRLIQKSFQKGFNDKFQKTAEERRQLEAERRQLEADRQALLQAEQTQDQSPGDSMEKVFQAYMKNPEAITDTIYDEISQLRELPSEHPEFREAQRKATELEKFERHLSLRKQDYKERQGQVMATLVEAQKELSDAIPDFVQKVEKLREFALNQLGYSQQEFLSLANPVTSGQAAIKFTKTLNRLYDMENASQTAETKVVTKDPPALARATASSPDKGEKTIFDFSNAEIENMDQDRFLALYEKQYGKRKAGLLD